MIIERAKGPTFVTSGIETGRAIKAHAPRGCVEEEERLSEAEVCSVQITLTIGCRGIVPPQYRNSKYHANLDYAPF